MSARLPSGSPDCHLGAWFQTFQLLGFTEGFMVLKLVFNFVLGKEKLQPAFVAVINVPLLVPHVMLLECIAIFEDLQAVRAQQMPSILMDHPKMDIYLRVERGAILTHLANVRHLSRLMSILHVLQKEWLTLKCPLTDLALSS